MRFLSADPELGNTCGLLDPKKDEGPDLLIREKTVASVRFLADTIPREQR